MVHIAESTVGRRYAGWFIKNTERTQKILDDLKNMPLPAPPPKSGPTSLPSSTSGLAGGAEAQATQRSSRNVGHKVAWGGVKVA
jgi:translation initiation factor 3 subunit L